MQTIKEYSPEEILLNTVELENVTHEYEDWKKPEEKRSKYKEITISFVINLLFNCVAIFPSFWRLNNFSKVVIIGIIIFISVYIIVSLTKWVDAKIELKNKKTTDIKTLILNKAKKNVKYTAIIRIMNFDNSNILYLTGNDYFLPHCTMDEEKTIEAQEKIIATSLQKDFNIKKEYITEIVAIDKEPRFSIKQIHGKIQMNVYVFYDVFINKQYKERLVKSDGCRKWISLEDMKQNVTAMSTNKDVIEILANLPNIGDSFKALLGDIKIIWNITSKCSHKCAICATYDEKRMELDANDKLKVLNSILSAKEKISSIDFAGGDPLDLEENHEIIRSAIAQLGEKNVSITTTGKGILTAMNKEFINVMKNFEITIDASHENLSSDYGKKCNVVSRKDFEYSNDNMKQVETIADVAETLTINVPIINDDLDDTEIDTLVNKLEKVKNEMFGVDTTVVIIRLMPVGKLSLKKSYDDYIKYNPIELIKKLQEKLKSKNIKYKLHCSLRVLNCFGNLDGNQCNMLKNKLGIDCAGNVFSCAWGGYLNTYKKMNDNPFYLGNLTRVNLEDILGGKSKTEHCLRIRKEIQRGQSREYCSVVSCYINKDISQNKDPLSVLKNELN